MLRTLVEVYMMDGMMWFGKEGYEMYDGESKKCKRLSKLGLGELKNPNTMIGCGKNVYQNRGSNVSEGFCSSNLRLFLMHRTLSLVSISRCASVIPSLI